MHDIPTPISADRLILGEGPGYDGDSDLAWWFDIASKALFLCDGTTQRQQAITLPLQASAAAITNDGRQLLLTERGIFDRDLADGSLHVVLHADWSTGGSRSNDARVHPSGAWWISTISKRGTAGAGAIYHFGKSELRRLWADMTTPNSICFSPDGATGYFADTAAKRILKVGLDPLTGLPSGHPQLMIQFDQDHPDGAVTDHNGNLWVAIWGGSRIICLGPDGLHKTSLYLPVPNVTCPAWVGPKQDHMLITTAREGMTPAQLSDYPQAGAVFLMKPGTMGPRNPRVIL
ncbi:SMP-30/gluconolactonase/LRE family protein [Ketogulonicigenium vulgare]|uniref:SMP-30/gluconolactonase/LRE family protein n=1 Tax=Ketogulonicigenium vulgare TaxID=92945 RepID=UPI0023597C7A|nr:SMP-30/gluconolactonase/LRE family protein [Ketogulonicigenium vulgare]